MPFDPVDLRRNRMAGDGPEDPVTISLNKSGEGMSIRLRLSAELLGLLRWKAGDRIQIAEGTAEDAGKLQLERVTRGGVKLAVRQVEGHDGSGVLQLRTGALRRHVTATDSQPPRAATNAVVGSALVVVAPGWMRPVKPAGLDL